MMTKFLLGIAIVAFTTFCGYVLTRKYRRKKLFFSQLKEFNERFLSEISYYRRPIQQFFTKYTYKEEFNDFLQFYLQRLRNEPQFAGQIHAFPDCKFLTEEEKGVIEDYFLMLGKGDSASQKAYFSSMKERLNKLQVESESAAKKYGDLYIKLGFLCGLLILILIL